MSAERVVWLRAQIDEDERLAQGCKARCLGTVGSGEDIQQRLALRYADRPGYRDEWRP